MDFRIPSVEVSNDGHCASVRSPNAEDSARLSVVSGEMGAHLVVDPIVAALIEQVEIIFGKELWAGYGNLIGAHRSGG